ncbi:MAG: SDR family NAD(P)-dependent oxidoreductase [Candidatus Nanopelagicales bacterium]
MALDERLALIVGAGPGNGLALARRFGREGFRLALVGHPGGAPLDLTGLDARMYAADAGEPDSLRQSIADIQHDLGDPAVVIYNPSYPLDGAPTVVSPEEVLKGLGVGAVGAVVATQAVYPAMAAARQGTLLFTGSGAGVNPWVGGIAVGMQKAALRNYVLGLAEEVKEQGIHAATVTIYGIVKAGSFFDPDRIAEQFWQVHTQPREAWQKEIDYRAS